MSDTSSVDTGQPPRSVTDQKARLLGGGTPATPQPPVTPKPELTPGPQTGAPAAVSQPAVSPSESPTLPRQDVKLCKIAMGAFKLQIPIEDFNEDANSVTLILPKHITLTPPNDQPIIIEYRKNRHQVAFKGATFSLAQYEVHGVGFVKLQRDDDEEET